MSSKELTAYSVISDAGTMGIAFPKDEIDKIEVEFEFFR